MEIQGNHDFGELGDEEFPDEFQCCVCLDIIFKPVVLACGHMCCFWCVHVSMHGFEVSHCPVCRHPYNHFPRICKLLHFLLLKLYPSAYKRRARQVAEEEKRHGNASPQLDGDINSKCSEVLDVRDISSPLMGATYLETGGEHSPIGDSSEGSLPCEYKPSTIPATSSSQSISNEAKCVVQHSNQFLATDLQCAVCKCLLCRPIVLNCGHVYCEACIGPHNSVCKCPTCQSAHPNGSPNVCLVLEHFLEERFPEEYSARKQSLSKFENASPSGNSTEKREQVAQYTSVPTNSYSQWLSGRGPNFHAGVGCDNCGMTPIVGLRYKCKDCVERVGFDLCDGCYNSSSKLPGRFNQKHTEDHKFDVIRPPNIVLSLEADRFYEYESGSADPVSPEIVLMLPRHSTSSHDNSSDVDHENDLEDSTESLYSSNISGDLEDFLVYDTTAADHEVVHQLPGLSNDASENELGSTSSHDFSDVDDDDDNHEHDLGDSITSPDSSNDFDEQDDDLHETMASPGFSDPSEDQDVDPGDSVASPDYSDCDYSDYSEEQDDGS